jgi:mono/diheme cytochrome c family protein
MNRLIKGLVLVVCVLAVGAAALVSVLAVRKPAQRRASSAKIEATPARLARGTYLVEHVCDCLTCHSDLQVERFNVPPKPGTLGQGGLPFGKEFAVPGVVCAQNITPDPENGLGKWTDGEILRAIREGVDKDGNALFPMMPYEGYRVLSDEDAQSIVVYLRSLPAVSHRVPGKKLDFPVNLLVKSVPKPLDGPVAAPLPKDGLAYGRYLAVIGGCIDCHTPHDPHGKPIAGREFSGGWEMKGPWGRNVTPNLTPHKDTFTGRATKAEFVGRFKSFESVQGDAIPPAPKGRNTIMPWLVLSGMTEEDLGAVYDYLKSLPPVENRINPFPDAPDPAPEAPAKTAAM